MAGTPAIDRAMSVLWYLAAHPQESFRMSELSRQLGLSKATAHGLLAGLERHGLVRRDERHKTYTLGPTLVKLAGAVAPEGVRAVEASQRQLGLLAHPRGVRCTVSGLFVDEVVSVAGSSPRLGGGVRVPIPSSEPRRLPWAPPIGPVFAAWAAPADRQAWLARAGSSRARARWEEHLVSIRRAGYDIGFVDDLRGRVLDALADAVTPDELRHVLPALEQDPASDGAADPATRATHNVTVPVHGTRGDAILILNASGFDTAMTDAEVHVVATRMIEAASRITSALRPGDPTTRSSTPAAS